MWHEALEQVLEQERTAGDVSSPESRNGASVCWQRPRASFAQRADHRLRTSPVEPIDKSREAVPVRWWQRWSQAQPPFAVRRESTLSKIERLHKARAAFARAGISATSNRKTSRDSSSELHLNSLVKRLERQQEVLEMTLASQRNIQSAVMSMLRKQAGNTQEDDELP